MPKSLRSSRSASRCLGLRDRREYLRVREGRRALEEEGEGVSPYFCEISWIARSISSRSDDGAGVEGGSFGVEGIGVSSFEAAACFFFFFLFLDFLTGVEGAISSDGTAVSSSSDGCASLS